MIDLQADITPGLSAAGFSLGDDFHAVVAAIGAFRRWQPEQGDLAAQLLTNSGWLYVPPARDGQVLMNTPSLYFRNSCVVLHFNGETKHIDCIAVGAGYQGRLWGNVRVGETLGSAMRHTELSYDQGEELYYSQRREHHGVLFYALEASVGKMPNMEIFDIIVNSGTMWQE